MLDVILSAVKTLNKVEFLDSTLSDQRSSLLAKREEESKLEKALEMNSKALVLVTTLFEKLNERGLVELDKLLAGSLNQVFPHRKYSVYHEITQERSYNSLNFYLVETLPDGKRQVSNIRNAVGGSIRAICGLVCLSFYLMKMNAERFIALDEALSQVDDDAVDGLFDLLTALGKEAGFQILMVSHDVRFKERFNVVYEVCKDGTVVKKKG